ncbi:hypothetical protein BV20DRAFT_966380 [Pilatotrama ljubarskyi]|nr:hypothetical protein BV20DRAFT_966380 [Pilatotrama ljubarskyi]
MARAAKDSEAGDKCDPRRPHIILRTLPSLSFSTPTHSISLQLSLHTLPRDKLTRMDPHSSTRPTSVQTFGDTLPTLVAGRSSPSSTSSVDSTIRSAVKELQKSNEETRGEVGELRGEVGELRGEVGKLRGRVDKLERRVQEMDERLTQRIDKLEKTVDEGFAKINQNIRALQTMLESTEGYRREEARRRAPAFSLPLRSPPRRHAQLPASSSPQTSALLSPPQPSAAASQSTPDLGEHGHGHQGRWRAIHKLKRVTSSIFKTQKNLDDNLQDLQAIAASLEPADAPPALPDASTQYEHQQPIAGPSGSSGSSRRAEQQQRELLGRQIQPGPR